jgi:hypothetical protein
MQVGRRLREARDDRAHGGLGEFRWCALVYNLRPQLHLDRTSEGRAAHARGQARRGRYSYKYICKFIYMYEADLAEA